MQLDTLPRSDLDGDHRMRLNPVAGPMPKFEVNAPEMFERKPVEPAGHATMPPVATNL